MSHCRRTTENRKNIEKSWKKSNILLFRRQYSRLNRSRPHSAIVTARQEPEDQVAVWRLIQKSTSNPFVVSRAMDL
ncbi:hypothetical protein QTP88_003492 [Uroleucon formosanum]